MTRTTTVKERSRRMNGDEQHQSGVRGFVGLFHLRRQDTNPEGVGRLQSYDLSFITKKLISPADPHASKPEQLYFLEEMVGKVDEKHAKALETEFRRYMTLVLTSHRQTLAPSKQIDMYWHLFVLDTKNYAKFCDDVFGRFVHHVPSTEKTRKQGHEIYIRTLTAYERMFGRPDAGIWRPLRSGISCEGEGSNTYGCGQGCDNCGQGG